MNAQQPPKNGENRPIITPGGPGGGPRNMSARINREKPKNAKGTILKLIRYIGRSKYLILLLMLVVVGSTLLSLAGPALQGEAINAITIDPALNKLSVDFDALIKILMVMGIVYI